MYLMYKHTAADVAITSDNLIMNNLEFYVLFAKR